MIFPSTKYCIDANVLIQAWQKYYSPGVCPEYWEVLNRFGKQGVIFLPEKVFEEITRTEDDLSKWLKQSDISVRKIDESVTRNLQLIYSTNEKHKFLVDNTKARSLADPWLIAHAMTENATVVTKEEKVTALNAKKIKIPNVCENMEIRWIDDFTMIQELGISFNCIFPEQKVK